MRVWVKTVLALTATATAAIGQVITPVWVQRIAPFGTQGNGSNSTVLINVNPADQLPILAGSRVEPNNNEDGTETQPVFVRLQRWDANRLLLFVAENGINETASMTPEQAALAAAYPDKSIVWIDSATGKSLGVAFHEADHPALLLNPPINVQDPAQGNQLAAYDPIFTFYWRPAVDEGPPAQRALYSGINHLILRYAPLADGSGWTNVPTLAYEEQVPGIGDGLTDANHGDSSDQRWRWRNLRVYGSGTNTTIIAGGGTWREGMHPQVLVTTDGLTFHPRGRVDDRSGGHREQYSGGGTGSRVVRYHTDSAHPNLEVYFQGHYPAYAYPGEIPERYVSDPDNLFPGIQSVADYNQQPDVAMFESTPGTTNSLSGATNNLPPFQWESANHNGLPIDYSVDGVSRYDGDWNCNLEANSNLDYVVAYSFPSWNNAIPVPSVGWIATHRLDGSISGGQGSSYQLPVTERDVPTPYAANVGNEALYNGWLEVTPDTTAPANLKKAEILGAFGPVGFGLFTVQNVAASISVPPPSNITVNELDPITISVGITGSPNTYTWTRNGTPLDPAKTNVLDGSLYYPKTVVQGVNKSTLFIKSSRAADTGLYRLSIVNPLSGTTATADVNVTVNPDTNAPNVLSVGSMADTSNGSQTVDVQFDKIVDLGGSDPSTDPGTARNTANYTFVSPAGAAVTLAEIRNSGKAVRLTVTGLLPATSFTLKVANVRNYTRTANTAIPPAGQTVSGTVENAFTATTDVVNNFAFLPGTTYNPAANEFEAESGGGDIWGAADDFHYAYKFVTGNFDVRVQVAAEDLTLPGNRNGIMLRESLDPASRFNYVTWNPGNIVGFHVRTDNAATPIWANPPAFNDWLHNFGPPPNVWMRLQRQGGITSAFISNDGHNWSAFGTTTNVIADPAYLGLATCNGGNTSVHGFTRYANYGNVSILTLQKVSGVWNLSWTGPGTLQTSTTSVNGPYTTAGNQSNPQTVTPGPGQTFYRLQQ